MAAEAEDGYKPNWPEDTRLNPNFKDNNFDWMSFSIAGLSTAVLGTILIATIASNMPTQAAETNAPPIASFTPIGQGLYGCSPNQAPTSTPREAFTMTPTLTQTPTPEGYIKPSGSPLPSSTPTIMPSPAPSNLEVHMRIVILDCYRINPLTGERLDNPTATPTLRPATSPNTLPGARVTSSGSSPIPTVTPSP